MWMVRIATFGATFVPLAFIGAISPVMARDEASGTYFVFVDDLPLVIGGGVQFQHSAVGGSVIVDELMFVAPSTPQFWFSGRVGIKCEDIGRVKVATGRIAVLFVPSRGALLGFWPGASSLLRLGRLRRAWGRRHGRCC